MIEPPAALPRVDADDAFIPSQSSAPAKEETADEADKFIPDALTGDPVAVVELLSEKEKASEEARPSLFERVTRTGRAAIGRVVADETPERCVGAADVIQQVDVERTIAQPPPEAESLSPSPAAEVVTVSEATTVTSVEVVPTPETTAEPEEVVDADDLLDIPAFLRRQAN